MKMLLMMQIGLCMHAKRSSVNVFLNECSVERMDLLV